MRFRRPSKATRALALAAVVAVTASCADDGATGGPPAGASSSSAPTTTAPAAPAGTDAPNTSAGGDDDAAGGDADSGTATNVNASMLDIAAPLVGGGTLDLSTLGDRPVLLWFWAPF